MFFQDMAKELQPAFILEVEKQELFIQAGLQDRVIQVRWHLHSCTMYWINKL